MYKSTSVPRDGIRHSIESQGDKPAFLQINQHGIMTIPIPIKMRIGTKAMMAKTSF
jgi:hypothetical protein